MSVAERPHRSLLLIAFALAALAPDAALAQFTRITDAANPVVADAGAPNFAGASWVDADSDGWPDLFVGDRALYRNLGNGSFSRILVPSNVSTIGNSWADVDNDGDPDLMLCGGLGFGPRFVRNDGGGAFTRIRTGVLGDSIGNVGWACSWGDYDADGFVDLVIARPSGFIGFGPNRLLRNLQDGTFVRVLDTDVTAVNAPYTVPTWSDFDLDGDLDLSIGAGPVSFLGPDYFYRNRRVEGGTPALQQITTGALATDLRDGQVVNWIDYDNDRDLDCFITNYNNRVNHLYRNDGGVHVRMTGAQVGPIATDVGINTASVWNDYDNDGDLDCFLVRNGVPCRYYRNDGGVFAAVDQGALTAATALTSAAADYDRDGDVDLYVSAPGTSKALYRNDLATGAHWLEAHLTGVESNRSAIGARIQVRATIGGQTVWQMREVSAQNTFDGHSSFVLHVGLGDATQVDELRIEWPRGRVETLENVPVDRIYDFTEGESSTTPVAAALVSATVSARGVELAWQGAGLSEAGARVERSPDGQAWTAIGEPLAEGADRLVFVDAAAPGRWGYRLSYRDEGGIVTTEPAWVEVAPAAFGIRAATIENGRRLRLSLDLDPSRDARLDLLDTQGRVIASETLTPRAGFGEHSLEIGGAPAGVYWIRLRQLERSAVRRVAVIR